MSENNASDLENDAAADQAKLVGAFVDEVKGELGNLQAENAELRARLKITAAERDAETAAAADLRKRVEAGTETERPASTPKGGSPKLETAAPAATEAK